MKILFFDYWLKGIANFNRLMPEIRRQYPNAEVKMVHVGSWKEHQDKIVNEHDGFKSYDISYYKTSSIYKVLKKEKPDILLILNLYYLFDKALVVFCRHLGIKSVYLAHGKYSFVNDDSMSKELKKDLKSHFLSKIRVDTINHLRNYFKSTLIDHKPSRFVKSMVAMVKNPASMTLNSVFTDELDADLKLVYYESDKKSLTDQRKFPDRNIFVVGNPELDGFVKNQIIPKEDFLNQYGLDSSPYILYLDDGFVQSRLMTKEDWYRHLSEIASIAKKNNRLLVIKLHPRTPLEEHQEFFTPNSIIPLGKNVDFKSLIHYSESAVSIISTTISFALLMGKRVISPRWGTTAHFSHVYPDNVIHYSHDISDFEKWITGSQACNTSASYIADNLGKLDGNAIERIVNLL